LSLSYDDVYMMTCILLLVNDNKNVLKVRIQDMWTLL